LRAHRLDQRLVAVAQIDAAPERSLIEDTPGPFAVGQVYRGEGAVFVDRHGRHRKLLAWAAASQGVAAVNTVSDRLGRRAQSLRPAVSRRRSQAQKPRCVLEIETMKITTCANAP